MYELSRTHTYTAFIESKLCSIYVLHQKYKYNNINSNDTGERVNVALSIKPKLSTFDAQYHWFFFIFIIWYCFQNLFFLRLKFWLSTKMTLYGNTKKRISRAYKRTVHYYYYFLSLSYTIACAFCTISYILYEDDFRWMNEYTIYMNSVWVEKLPMRDVEESNNKQYRHIKNA